MKKNSVEFKSTIKVWAIPQQKHKFEISQTSSGTIIILSISTVTIFKKGKPKLKNLARVKHAILSKYKRTQFKNV